MNRLFGLDVPSLHLSLAMSEYEAHIIVHSATLITSGGGVVLDLSDFDTRRMVAHAIHDKCYNQDVYFGEDEMSDDEEYAHYLDECDEEYAQDLAHLDELTGGVR